jgi:hypothetical protein
MRNNKDWESIKNSVNSYGKTPIICSKSQFKGNTVSMVTEENLENGDRNISIHNRYYSGDVSQVYDINNDLTHLRYGTFTISPKWLRRKIQAICTDHSINSLGFEIRINSGDLCIVFASHMYTSHLKLRRTGLALEGNLGSLERLKDIKRVIIKARNIIKHIDTDTLVDICKVHNRCYMSTHMFTLSKHEVKVGLSE